MVSRTRAGPGPHVASHAHHPARGDDLTTFCHTPWGTYAVHPTRGFPGSPSKIFRSSLDTSTIRPPIGSVNALDRSTGTKALPAMRVFGTASVSTTRANGLFHSMPAKYAA